MRSNFLKIALHLSAAGLLIVAGSSCSSVSNMTPVTTVSPGTNACPVGVGGLPSSCCDPTTGEQIYPPPSSSCTVSLPGGTPITGTLGAGSASAGSSAGENTAAQGLVGGQKAMAATLGQSSAATAAQAVPSTSSLFPAMATNALNPNSSSGSAIGGAGGSGDASGSVATAPAAVASDSPGDGSANTEVAAYSSASGAGGLLPNGAKETAFKFSNGLVGGGDGSGLGGKSGELGFGEGRGPASAMGSEDPADYFTRIGLADSLFKKVEKRYREQSVKWLQAQFGQTTLPTVSAKLQK